MIEYTDARRHILEHVAAARTEAVPCARAHGTVLARDVVAHLASPPFDKAAMDGYAVREADVQKLPVELELVGEARAGLPAETGLEPGQAVAIATGAPVPAGADMVVMVEHTELIAGSRVLVRELSGRNICPAGEDFRSGECVIKGGQVLTPMRIGLAASCGADALTVYRRPSGALLCTGSEIVEPGEDVRPGQICNANGAMLSALMSDMCRTFVYQGIVRDDPPLLTAALEQALQADAVVITGGVSVGRYDLVPGILEQLGVQEVFHGVAVKPGKPLFFGVRDRTLVFGMPGNPQSCFVVFYLLVAPALAAAAGHRDPGPHFLEGIACEGFPNKPARMNVVPCIVERDGGLNRLHRGSSHGSADIAGPSNAEAYFIVPRGTEYVEEGQELRFFYV
jgi:molybdopterin molybdotransferase